MAAITLAVVPSSTPGDSRIALERLCVALGEVLDGTVHAVHPESYVALISELEKDRVQFAWMSPTLVVIAQHNLRLTPLLSAVRGDRTEYCAALFVDAETSITTIEQLRGKTVAWVDTMSAAGYLLPRLELAARGVDPVTHFGRELFLRSHAEVVRAVFDGRADLGATYAQRPLPGETVVRAGFTDVAPDRTARVLEWTGPIPNDVIVGHGLLAPSDHRTFANAIMTLAENDRGRQLLYNAFHAERFVATPKGALRPLWNLVRLARMHGLMNQL